MNGPQILPRHRMRIAREYAHLSQRGLAEVVGVTHTEISDWEKGRRLPSPYALQRYAAACGVDPDWVLRDAAGPNRVSCPACRRVVYVSGLNSIVVVHNDTAGNDCPMGARSLHVEPAAVSA